MRVATLLASSMLAVTALAGCQSGPTSLPDVLEALSSEAGSDQIARLRVERSPDQKLVVTGSFLVDGGIVEVTHRRGEEARRLPSPPTPSVRLAAIPVTAIDFDGLNERLNGLHCDHPRAEILTFGDHWVENVWCWAEETKSGRLDGKAVPAIGAGEFEQAASRVREDAGLLDAAEVSRVTIAMTSTQVWTRVQVLAPEHPTSGGSCAVQLTRASGALVPVCEIPSTGAPASALDPEVMTQIWEQEGRPASDWTLELIGGDEPVWKTRRGKESKLYTLDGTHA